MKYKYEKINNEKLNDIYLETIFNNNVKMSLKCLIKILTTFDVEVYDISHMYSDYFQIIYCLKDKNMVSTFDSITIDEKLNIKGSENCFLQKVKIEYNKYFLNLL